MVTSTTLHEVVWDRLDAISDIDTYDAESPATPPTDEDGRVSAHAILYTSPGGLFASALDGNQQSIAGSFQVTCVGGDVTRALECIDIVRAGLVGEVIVNGVVRVIRSREEDLGPLRVGDDWPPRYYMPLEFQLFAP